MLPKVKLAWTINSIFKTSISPAQIEPHHKHRIVPRAKPMIFIGVIFLSLSHFQVSVDRLCYRRHLEKKIWRVEIAGSVPTNTATQHEDTKISTPQKI